MRRFDVAIAGSGPAGAACALRLARCGIAVALIDPKAFPRRKLCGEYVNLAAIRELRELGVAEELHAAASPLRGMRLYAHDESAEFPLPSQAWSLARICLDDVIRRAAVRAGATPLQARVRALHERGDSIELELNGADGEPEKIHARYVVGADGMRSAVARLCGIASAQGDARFAIGGHIAAAGFDGWIEMYARGAEYVALNPLDERTANCVFVVEKQRLQRSRGRLSEEFEPLSAALSNSRRIVTGGFTANAAALGPLAHRAKRAALPRILLAGDAAAFVDPFTGQGVYLALAAARMAAEAIERALWQPAAEREAWIAYEGGIWALVAERDRIAAMMKMMLGLRAASQRAARALRRRPSDFAFLIDAVCGNVRTHNAAQLAVAVGKALL